MQGVIDTSKRVSNFLDKKRDIYASAIISLRMLLSHVKHFHPPPTDDADSSLFPEVVGVNLGDTVTPNKVDVLSEGVHGAVWLKILQMGLIL